MTREQEILEGLAAQDNLRSLKLYAPKAPPFTTPTDTAARRDIATSRPTITSA